MTYRKPEALVLNAHGRQIVADILDGRRAHKDIKDAFDWENTPEGHRYWSLQRQAAGLSGEARMKLERALYSAMAAAA